jgi:protein required for attachment to host cells
MHGNRLWMLVADGGGAHVYRGTGNKGTHVALIERVDGADFERDHHTPKGPQDGRDKAHAPTDAGHGVVAHERSRRRTETEFVKDVVAWLDEPARRETFDHLIVAAPPRVLGDIRGAMSPHLAAKVSREIHSDLVKAPIKQLESEFMSHVVPVKAA